MLRRLVTKMKFIPYHSLIIVFLFLLFAPTLPSSAAAAKKKAFKIPSAGGKKQQMFRIPVLKPANPALKRLCESTYYPALCVSSLSPFLLTGRNDPVGLLTTAIGATSRHAMLSLAAFSRLEMAEKGLEQELAICTESYQDAVDSLQGAIEAISKHDKGTTNSMLSAVVTDSETCKDAFNSDKSPVSEYNERLRKMGSNCLAIAAAMKWP